MMNDQGASSYANLGRLSRGGRSVGTGASDASTVSTGIVTAVRLSRTNAVILECRPETSPASRAHVEVTLLTPYASNGGGSFIAPRVGDKITWLTAGGHGYYLGMSHQAKAQPPFTGPLPEADFLNPSDNTAGAAMLTSGSRIPDQSSGTMSDQLVPVANAQVPGSPGTDPAKTPGADVLMDPTTNTLRSVSEINGTASPNEPYEIPDTVFDKSSAHFKNVMKAMNVVKDPAYTTAKGFGFNEISTRSRVATVQGGSGSTTGSSTATSGTSPTNYGSVTPPGAKQSAGATTPPTESVTSYSENPVSDYANDQTFATNNENPGGVLIYGQDFLDLYSSGQLSSTATANSSHYAGKQVWIEAGEEIVLQVGDSSITINQNGIAIGQRALGGIGSSFKISNDSIEAFSVSHEISAWTYDVSVPWATINLSPMNAVIAACQGVEIKSGFQNFVPFAENLAEFAIQMTIMTADISDAKSAEERKDLGEDMADETLMALLGVPVNIPVSTTSADSPLSVPPGFAALDIIGPALGMLTGIASEVKACLGGKGGSATVKLNNADVTIQGGYIEQIPKAVITAMKEQVGIMAAAAVVSIGAGVASQKTSFGGSAEAGLVGGAAGLATIMAAAVAARGAAEATEEPLLVAGSGNVRIEASASLTSGAYRSETETGRAIGGAEKNNLLGELKAGDRFFSVVSAFNALSAVGYSRQLTKPAFAGVSGVGVTNAFTYHNLEIINSTVTSTAVAINADQKETVAGMANVLLEGPTAQDHLSEGKHALEGTSESTSSRTEKGTTTEAAEKTTMNNPDGSSETTTHKTNLDGSTETTSKKTAKDGSSETTTTKTDIDGTVTIEPTTKRDTKGNVVPPANQDAPAQPPGPPVQDNANAGDAGGGVPPADPPGPPVQDNGGAGGAGGGGGGVPPADPPGPPVQDNANGGDGAGDAGGGGGGVPPADPPGPPVQDNANGGDGAGDAGGGAGGDVGPPYDDGHKPFPDDNPKPSR